VGPRFHSFAATYPNGDRIYGACLTFIELATEQLVSDLRDRCRHLPAASTALHGPARRGGAAARPAAGKAALEFLPSKRASHPDETHSDDEGSDSEPAVLERMYAPKCICLLSHYPFLAQFRAFLIGLFRANLIPSKVTLAGDAKLTPPPPRAQVPLERILSNFLHEVPVPPLGQVEVQYAIGDSAVSFKRAPANDPLSLSYVPVRHVFDYLDLTNAELVWLAVLLERQILVLSSHLSVLTVFAEALLGLIYPFQWRHVYIPLLPKAFVDYINAPMPFIIGCHTSYVDRADLQDEIVVVDLDRNTVGPVHGRTAQWTQSLPAPAGERRRFLAAMTALADAVGSPRDRHATDDAGDFIIRQRDAAEAKASAAKKVAAAVSRSRIMHGAIMRP
jgi:hypothetical protein